jgi:hypothetical protein
MWGYLLSLLTTWSADPAALDQEPPRAAAAVAYAYAAMAPDVLSKYEPDQPASTESDSKGK